MPGTDRCRSRVCVRRTEIQSRRAGLRHPANSTDDAVDGQIPAAAHCEQSPRRNSACADVQSRSTGARQLPASGIDRESASKRGPGACVGQCSLSAGATQYNWIGRIPEIAAASRDHNTGSTERALTDGGRACKGVRTTERQGAAAGLCKRAGSCDRVRHGCRTREVEHQQAVQSHRTGAERSGRPTIADLECGAAIDLGPTITIRASQNYRASSRTALGKRPTAQNVVRHGRRTRQIECDISVDCDYSIAQRRVRPPSPDLQTRASVDHRGAIAVRSSEHHCRSAAHDQRPGSADPISNDQIDALIENQRSVKDDRPGTQ